jgi:hypothetical protein
MIRITTRRILVMFMEVNLLGSVSKISWSQQSVIFFTGGHWFQNKNFTFTFCRIGFRRNLCHWVIFHSLEIRKRHKGLNQCLWMKPKLGWVSLLREGSGVGTEVNKITLHWLQGIFETLPYWGRIRTYDLRSRLISIIASRMGQPWTRIFLYIR